MSNPVNVQKESGTNVATGELQVLGTSTNDNAPAGGIGEYAENSVAEGDGIALTGGITVNVTSISLTAGDWDVWANGAYTQSGATEILQTQTSVSTTSAQIGVGAAVGPGPTSAGSVNATMPVVTRRFSLATTTTIYLTAVSYFGGGTLKAYGGIFARRAR